MEDSCATRFFEEALKQERNNNFSEAIVCYMKAIQCMTEVTCSPGKFGEREKHEFKYHINTVSARVMFLVGVSEVPKRGRPPAYNIVTSQNPKLVSRLWKSESELADLHSTGYPNDGHGLKRNCNFNADKKNTSQINKDYNESPDHMRESEPNKDFLRLKSELSACILVEKPNVSWDSIIGIECAKQGLREAFLVPLLYPGTAQARFTWKGIMLFGVCELEIHYFSSSLH
jgi:SpoVK/Ycf46/Vps4 family AAA+-type ATPase